MIELKLLFMLFIANGVPVIVKDLLGKKLSYPIDCNLRFIDGRPFFGKSKTFRGLITAVIVTMATAPLMGFDWSTGLIIGIAAMTGDLLSSFIKRRINKPPSSQTLGLDQIPESFFPLLACKSILDLDWMTIVIVVTAFFTGSIILSHVLYKLHIRERPY